MTKLDNLRNKLKKIGGFIKENSNELLFIATEGLLLYYAADKLYTVAYNKGYQDGRLFEFGNLILAAQQQPDNTYYRVNDSGTQRLMVKLEDIIGD